MLVVVVDCIYREGVDGKALCCWYVAWWIGLSWGMPSGGATGAVPMFWVFLALSVAVGAAGCGPGGLLPGWF